MKSNKDAKLSTRLEPELAEAFQRIVDEQDLSKAQVMRKLIREYVKKHKQEVEMNRDS